MSLWMIFQRWAEKHFTQLNTKNLLLTLFSYICLSWIFLYLANEHDLTHSISNFIYYLFVTASTVGYGDMSPSTDMGKWVVALFIIPGGLGLFAIVIGRVASTFILYWKRGLLGKRRIKVKQHILILGWNEKRTLHLIKMLQHEEKGYRPIVLCSRHEIENPLPGEIEFVKVSNFTDHTDMSKACVNNASCIIIDNGEDDITFTAALFCAHQNEQAHILVYFQDESLSNLLKMHCPNAECIPSVAVEMLAKSAVDPGSSELHHELLSTHEGMTQYSVYYPINSDNICFEQLFSYFKQEYDAILIAVDKGKGMGVEVNPKLDSQISSGDKLFYIADERVRHINWPL